MALPRITIVGGHGKVALYLAKTAAQSAQFQVESIVRSKDHFRDIESRGAKPVLLSLEEASVDDLANVFTGAQAVVFAAGAGGKGGAERTKAVDELGAIKVFDAIERVKGDFLPKLYMVSAIDTRDLSKPPPAHYTQNDIQESEKSHKAIPAYFDAKLAADRNLHQRKSFFWTILRPGHLSDDAGTGKVSLGKTHMGSVSREDVATVLFELIKTPGKAASGLALDLVQGETPVSEAVQQAVARGESDFID
ncbi:hypothetical protein OIO90_000614 [Microbotryomycetes sp. JL221]|nr:hypothetical protein OIO90_000614 [Microbotryomycetes sp. JL221]